MVQKMTDLTTAKRKWEYYSTAQRNAERSAEYMGHCINTANKMIANFYNEKKIIENNIAVAEEALKKTNDIYNDIFPDAKKDIRQANIALNEAVNIENGEMDINLATDADTDTVQNDIVKAKKSLEQGLRKLEEQISAIERNISKQEENIAYYKKQKQKFENEATYSRRKRDEWYDKKIHIERQMR